MNQHKWYEYLFGLLCFPLLVIYMVAPMIIFIAIAKVIWNLLPF